MKNLALQGNFLWHMPSAYLFTLKRECKVRCSQWKHCFSAVHSWFRYCTEM